MQGTKQSHDKRSCSGRRIRRRSLILRDGADLVSLAGYPADIGGANDLTLSHLAIPSVLAAFRIATSIEGRRSRAALAQSGTLQKYEQIVRRLAVADRQNDPYAEYRRRQQVGLWTSKSSREEARSATSRHAADQVMMLASPFLQLMIARLPLMADRSVVLRAHKMLILARLTAAPGLLSDSYFPLDSCIELARASRFLTEQREKRPAPVTNAFTPAKAKTGKRAVLTALHRHETALRRTQNVFDWRDHFWSHVRRDHYIDQTETACIAALMVTGCRPGELADDNSIAISARNSAARPLLCVYICGAKVFRPSEVDPNYEPVVNSVGAGPPSEADRGQPWRALTIACHAPEAIWLHGYLRGYGRIDGDGVVHGTADSAACVHLSLRDPASNPSGRWLHPSERSRRAVGSLTKTVSRIGKLAFPKLAQAVTPYVFRHAFATDLRASGTHSGEAMAKALGHLSMRSMSAYGTRGTARRGIRVEAVRDIDAPITPRARKDTHPKRKFEQQLS